MLINIIIATLIVSLISLVGIIISHKKIKKFLHYFISFAAGALISVALFDLIPHALEKLEQIGIHAHQSFIFVVMGIVLFFLIERFIHWHHCGNEHCHQKPAGILILTGDFIHNFLDGILIAGAFMLSNATGVFTTLTVLLHEIPQEFGDYAVLIHSGFSKKKALLLNFLSALSAVFGGIIGFLLFEVIDGIAPYFVLATAGGFLYIALSDIVPSMHKGEKKKMLVAESLIFILTMAGFYFLISFLH